MYAEEMKAYVRPGPQYLLVGLFLIAFGLWMLPQTLWFGLLELGGSILLLWVHHIRRQSYREIIRDLEKSALMIEAIADFPESSPMARNRVRFGKRYLYARRNGVIVAYTDISHLDLTINPGKELQNLFVITSGGKRHLLCTLPYNKRGKAELGMLIFTIRAKNPQILMM